MLVDHQASPKPLAIFHEVALFSSPHAGAGMADVHVQAGP